MKQKAARNKTIDFSLEEGHEYLERCILAENSDQLKTALQDGSTMTPDALYDQYIIGDTFQVMKQLPLNFVDLLIVDPPYNLAKDYHGNKFNAVGREEYREYTIKWVREVLPLLKKTASIYVCCDWRSSLIIGDVLQEYFCGAESDHVAARKRTRREIQLEKRDGRYLVCDGEQRLYVSFG